MDIMCSDFRITDTISLTLFPLYRERIHSESQIALTHEHIDTIHLSCHRV